jgi:hypothetical protein
MSSDAVRDHTLFHAALNSASFAGTGSGEQELFGFHSTQQAGSFEKSRKRQLCRIQRMTRFPVLVLDLRTVTS